MTDLILDGEVAKWLRAIYTLLLDVILSQGLGEVSLGFLPRNPGLSLGTWHRSSVRRSSSSSESFSGTLSDRVTSVNFCRIKPWICVKGLEMWTVAMKFKIELIASSYVSLLVLERFQMPFRTLPKIRCDEILLGFKFSFTRNHVSVSTCLSYLTRVWCKFIDLTSL